MRALPFLLFYETIAVYCTSEWLRCLIRFNLVRSWIQKPSYYIRIDRQPDFSDSRCQESVLQLLNASCTHDPSSSAWCQYQLRNIQIVTNFRRNASKLYFAYCYENGILLSVRPSVRLWQKWTVRANTVKERTGKISQIMDYWPHIFRTGNGIP